ncbi:MAG TPA: BolA family protein [Gallionella sp.]|nr:BolA family protein [Gallionella sp.]
MKNIETQHASPLSRKAGEGANDRCADFSTTEAIRDSLAALDPVALDIVDDSHKHVGHAAAGGGGHYGLRIVSAQFIGKNTVARHRMIYSALGELMKSDIHALNIQAKTPDEI